MDVKKYKRLLYAPQDSYFLLGPDSTGKSAWLLEAYPNAHRIDLGHSSTYLNFKRDPSLLRTQVMALESDSCVMIDEIQRLPELLAVVRALLRDTKKAYSFILSGSSLRTLKRQEFHLLAGEMPIKQLFPLSALEIGDDFSLQKALLFGQLPSVWVLQEEKLSIEFLDAYVERYLLKEIQQEALVRRPDAYFRFLGLAALQNGQILNLSKIAKDLNVARSTVQSYVEILQDTFFGWLLPAFRPGAKVKEIAHPKVYFFDCGIMRALRQETRRQASPSEFEEFFKTFFINEIRVLNFYRTQGATLSYWQATHGSKVDLIISYPHKRIACEITHSATWRKEDNKALHALLESKAVDKAYGVYTGTQKLFIDGIEIFPYQMALSLFEKT